MSGHKFCCLEAIAYAGEEQVAWMCLVCGRIWHSSIYYQVKKGLSEFFNGNLQWERIWGI